MRSTTVRASARAPEGPSGRPAEPVETGGTDRPDAVGPAGTTDPPGWRRRIRPHVLPVAVIGVSVLLANLPAILGLVSANPLVVEGGLVTGRSGVLPGYPFIDPNAGFTLQALGHLAALDWLHGHVPWWNAFEGVGSPLAGEVQSGALFPLTLLLVFHQGFLLLQLSLELLAGCSTYALTRHLGVGRTVAAAAGVAFGLCGTFAWFAHAPIRPVAFLPLALLGVERAMDAAGSGRRGGWRLLAVAVGLSILAGFPETTAIDGLFVLWWAVLRLLGPGRPCWRAMATKVIGGGVAGVAIAAPLLVAFDSYLPFADVGTHAGSGLASVSLPAAGLSQTVLPYVFGPIFGLHAAAGQNDPISYLWSNVGGYLDVTLLAAALVGLVGRRHRRLRVGIAAWVAVCLLRTFGWPPVVHLMAHLPGISSTAFYRYADPSWELAVVVLAALGLDDIARTLTRRWVLAAAVVATAGLAAWSTVTAWPILTATVPPDRGPQPHDYALGSLGAALVLLAGLLVGGIRAGRPAGRGRSGPRADRSRRRGRVVMAGVVAVESIALLGFTYLSAPPVPAALQTGSVTWLQHHLGTSRFYTFGPIQPNYGSYFQIAQLNLNDSPWPKAMNAEILGGLDPNSIPGIFTGGARASVAGPTPAQELERHLAAFESLGVRYVVEGAGGTDIQGTQWPAPGSPAWPAGPRLVYRDGFAEIWQLPAAAPAFSAGPGCSVAVHGWDAATVTCPHPSVLLRRVQYLPGWTATADGSAVAVTQASSGPSGLFQQVRVPAGTTTVDFTFTPPHELLAFAAAVVAAGCVVGSLVRGRRRRLAPTVTSPAPAGPGDPPAPPGTPDPGEVP